MRAAASRDRISPIERWFLAWGLVICAGVLAGFAQPVFARGRLAYNSLGTLQLICWHLGAVGLVVTVAALGWARGGRECVERAVRQANQTWLALLCSILVGFGMSEGMLRVAFRDGASFTDDHGPIVRRFARHYAFNRFQSRGPDAIGEKPRGRVRIMVQGDSITFGQGMTDGRALYPVVLLQQLEQSAPGRFDMAVMARPGREIDFHLQQLHEFGAAVNPDVVIYQWVPNDMELDKSGRPRPRGMFWRTFAWHQWLYNHSYAWWFMDHQFDSLAYAMQEQPYTEYIRDTFAPGSPAWAPFEALFRQWAESATALTPRVVLLLYPEPAGGVGAQYPLRAVHAQVKALAAPYGFETIDMAEEFADLTDWRQVHVSAFESHPNAVAHRRMASALLERLQRAWPELIQPAITAQSLASPRLARDGHSDRDRGMAVGGIVVQEGTVILPARPSPTPPASAPLRVGPRGRGHGAAVRVPRGMRMGIHNGAR